MSAADHVRSFTIILRGPRYRCRGSRYLATQLVFAADPVGPSRLVYVVLVVVEVSRYLATQLVFAADPVGPSRLVDVVLVDVEGRAIWRRSLCLLLTL
jgi:hypothetical protein